MLANSAHNADRSTGTRGLGYSQWRIRRIPESALDGGTGREHIYDSHQQAAADAAVFLRRQVGFGRQDERRGAVHQSD